MKRVASSGKRGSRIAWLFLLMVSLPAGCRPDVDTEVDMDPETTEEAEEEESPGDEETAEGHEAIGSAAGVEVRGEGEDYTPPGCITPSCRDLGSN